MRNHIRINYRTALTSFALISVGVIINVFLAKAVKPQGLPLYMDTFGTVLVSLLGGPLPGVLTALFTSLIRGALYSWMHIYFCVISVFVAVLTAWFKNKGIFKSFGRSVIAVAFIAVMSGFLSALLTWFVYGFTTGEGVTAKYSQIVMDLGIVGEPRPALFVACLFIDLVDKAVTMSAAVGIWYALPAKIKDSLDDPVITNSYAMGEANVKHPLLRKVIAVVLVAEVLLGALACGITYYIYRDTSVNKFTDICRGVTDAASAQIDAERIDEYIELGESADGYTNTENVLYSLRDSFPQIEYVYVYRIEEDCCRVVFDLDTEDEPGGDPGDEIPFDESFEEMLPALHAGEEIDPIITDDTFGWLLTIYNPLKNMKGETVCYVCADITMDEILTDQAVFISKMFSLYFAVSVIIMCIVIELAKSSVVYPINAMARAANSFAYDTDTGRSTSLDELRGLNINSDDEISNLYESLEKMAVDSDSYIKEVKDQAELISAMQEEIILDFAEMVEARDQCTGDHIKKTSYYVRVIAEELKNEGKFPELLDDEYIKKLVRSAPLHDVGKIKISDLILNKPGRLTDEEFGIMKYHTTAGKEILSKTSGVALSSGYLKEAIEMAAYHHERWDGTGYPTKLKGEDIPLSARIMAVADVFDALVSQRSYKKPFSYEKAIEIITEESGTHFDPTVVEAFLKISKKAYRDEATEGRAAHVQGE